MSASAPAGRMTRNTGNVVAAVTRLTISGDVVSCVMSQPAPTFCIQVPMYEMTAAPHRERNSGSFSGAHAEVSCRTCKPPGMFTDSAISISGDALHCAWQRLAERPLVVLPRTNHVNQNSGQQDHHCVPDLLERVGSRKPHENNCRLKPPRKVRANIPASARTPRQTPST